MNGQLMALTEMRDEVLYEARKTGDTAFQAYVDRWLNAEASRINRKYRFPGMLTRWKVALSSTAPTPHTWAPTEITSVPRDMVELVAASILDTTGASRQPFSQVEIVPGVELMREISTVNPPPAGTPSKIGLRRQEGAREHAFDPTTGTTGIRGKSTATETATIQLAVTYYADAARTQILKAVITSITAAPQSVVSGAVYGIKSLSKSEDTTGVVTVDNTAGTIVFAEILPWERTASYPVLMLNALIGDATHELHLTYKRAPEYMSNLADTLAPMPQEAQDVIMEWTKSRALQAVEDTDWQVKAVNANRLEKELLNAYDFQRMEESYVIMT